MRNSTQIRNTLFSEIIKEKSIKEELSKESNEAVSRTS